MGTAMGRIQAGNAISAFGIGFTVPFLYVYVAEVRHLGAFWAMASFIALAVGAVLTLPFAGRAIDRRGPIPVLIAAAFTAAAGALALGLSSGVATVLLFSVVLGAGQAVMQPALATMIVNVSTPQTRTRAFALQFFMQNLGLGIGGLLGGLIVDVSRPGSFLLLFSIETAMFLALAAIITTVRLPQESTLKESAPKDPAPAGGGLGALLRHKPMVYLCLLGFVMYFACYGQFESGLTAYGTEAGIAPRTLGFALAANTGVIVVAQFAVLRFVERASRTKVIAIVGLIWTAAWIIAGFAGLTGSGPALAATAFVSTYALFGLGEAMLSPTVAPLVADLAPDGKVGLYNSAFAMVKQIALVVGPLVGVPLGAVLPAPYVAAFVVFCLGFSWLALRLGRQLTAAQDRPFPVLRPSRIVAQHSPATENGSTAGESAAGESVAPAGAEPVAAGAARGM
ncbi:MFS transporter [Streptomyces sp. NRRL S-87]|uniref:MFS transporter n=1 Tax=Streptomyces sp. NRRL S-87 TaxID=1463920 RepID=UPI0019013D45|nr:MFS transporter [Streptomyces sp. NRRL S-87]